jgi:hypothetical protein
MIDDSKAAVGRLFVIGGCMPQGYMTQAPVHWREAILSRRMLICIFTGFAPACRCTC